MWILEPTDWVQIPTVLSQTGWPRLVSLAPGRQELEVPRILRLGKCRENWYKLAILDLQQAIPFSML